MKKFKKVIIIIILVIIVLAGCFIGLSAYCSNTLKEEQTNTQEVFNESGSHKALILYQDSAMGLTKNIVTETANELVKKAYSVTINHPRSDLDYNLTDYEIVVLISPVYAKKISQPLIDYAKNHSFASNDVFVVITGQMLNETKEIETLKAAVNNPKSIMGIKINGINDDYKKFLGTNN